jgi:hypothetical protein
MNAEEREAMERANRLAQELLDRDWREQGVSQEDLDRSRLLEQQFNAELNAGHTVEDVLQHWEGKTPVKKRKRVKPTESSPTKAM